MTPSFPYNSPYTVCVTTPIPTRFKPEELAALDELVRAGVADNRSDAVRLAVAELYQRHKRAEVGRAIAEAYRTQPQSADDDALALANALALTEAEPW
jgi:Arc/MetJ-type ribon-helix-helix transcriptional regulator